jgi:malate dehydrogenase
MKIAIIGGAGTLGSCIAYTLALKGLTDELVLLDINSNLLLAHIMDISTAITGIQNTKLWAGNDEDLHHSDIVIVVVGVPFISGSSRLDMLRNNLLLMKEIIRKIETYCPEAIVITATNPVDSINLGIFLMSTVLDRKKLLGYNLNDSIRFQMAVAKELGNQSTEVEALALGEHMEALALIFSSIKVNKKSITISDETKHRLKKEVPNLIKSYINLGINRTSGWTSAVGISQMVQSIIADSKRVFPCSAVVKGEYGYEGISIGVPVTLGKKGIDRITELVLTPDEQRDMDHSATELAKKARMVKGMIENIFS